MKPALYIAACLIIPAIWGLAASWVYDRVTARRPRLTNGAESGPDMYHI